MDTTWAFRQAYDHARQIKEAQDAFCADAERGAWDAIGGPNAKFPEDLKWEALVDVLRGRVKVHNRVLHDRRLHLARDRLRGAFLRLVFSCPLPLGRGRVRLARACF